MTNMAYRGFANELKREIGTPGLVPTNRLHTDKWS